MKVVGLITEYNPFHNGHLYHINEAVRLTHADHIVVIMSGNYVQRGTPAIMPKHLRTQMALASGVSAVIELPLQYATASAEYFAFGAVSLLESLSCIDYLCFGSECGDIESLTRIADVLIQEPEAFQNILQEQMKSGVSFPLARQQAMLSFLGPDSVDASLLESPNNILGIEYIKSIRRLGSKIIPLTIQRKSSNYHDAHLSEKYSSASAIRNLLEYSQSNVNFKKGTSFKSASVFNATQHLRTQIPKHCYSIMEDTYMERFPVYTNDFSLLLRQVLLNETRESLATYFDVTEDIANRIIKYQNRFINFEQFCETLKTKNTTYTRISRCLLHILLGIKKEDITSSLEDITPSLEDTTSSIHHYIRILGFRKDASKLLKVIQQKSNLPIITKLTAIDALSPIACAMLSKEIYAANLYESVVTNRYNTSFIHELEQSIILL